MKGRLGALLSVALLSACDSTGDSASHRSIEFDTSFVSASLPDSVGIEVFVPAGISSVDGVIVSVGRRLDQYLFDAREWRTMCARIRCALVRLNIPDQPPGPPEEQFVRNATLGGADALLTGLALAADRSGLADLREAPLLFFGFSAAGTFGPTFAGLKPGRTAGFIQYHSNMRGVAVDTAALALIPALIIVGEDDQVAGTEPSRVVWHALRARNAPWAFVSHIGQPHLSIDGLVEAGSLMRDWAEAILSLRVDDGTGGRRHTLIPVAMEKGSVVDDTAGAALGGHGASLGWIPVPSIGVEMRLLTGACSLMAHSSQLEILLGPSTVVHEDVASCQQTSRAPSRELWISTNRLATAAEALRSLERWSGVVAGTSMPGLGNGAYFTSDAGTCSTVGAAYDRRTYYLSWCGEGVGAVSDSAYLRLAVEGLVGG